MDTIEELKGRSALPDTIIVDDICKSFKIYKDKSHTLKSRILSRSRNSYELNHVIDHISFTLKKGDAVGLIGHNGSGKSTTLKLLNRIIYPESGSIKVKGKVSSLIELGAGFHPDMTGRENIYINATIFGLKKEEIDRRLDDIIRFSELEEFIDNPVRTYSSGMYMRLAFAVAINVDADVLLIDEILAVGDANFQKKCFDKLQEIKYNGATIVIVSHSMDQIKSICNRVIWLEDGKIKEDGKPRVVCKDYLDEMEEKAEERRRKELLEEGKNADNDPTYKYPPIDVYKKASVHAKRQGKMNIRFQNIIMMNSDYVETDQFGIGSDITLKGQIIKDNVSEISNIIIKMFNKFGGHCSSLESKWTQESIAAEGNLINMELTMRNLQLIPGDYFLECAIKDDKGELADNLVHFIEFSINPKYNNDRDNYGVIHIDYDWDIK